MRVVARILHARESQPNVFAPPPSPAPQSFVALPITLQQLDIPARAATERGRNNLKSLERHSYRKWRQNMSLTDTGLLSLLDSG